MQETTKKIADDSIKSFAPVIEQMASEGCDTDQIVRAFQNHVRMKQGEFYRRPDFVRLGKQLTVVIESLPDSKAEAILIGILQENGIGCVFHRKIGPYTADYLVAEKVIVELDGPQHKQSYDDRRDKYLRRMGYEIIRIPIWALSINTNAIIDEIKEITKTRKVKSGRRK